MTKNLFKILFFIGIFIIFLHPIDSDGDFFQHVNIGRHVWEKHSLPYLDELTFTAAGKPYLGYSWGTGLIFYSLYKYTGPIGINLLVAAVATSTAFLLFHFLRIITKSDQISFLTIALSFPTIATRFPSRPEIMTYLFVAALLLLNELRQRSPHLNWLFPLTILLWANMYSVSLMVGLGLLILFAINQWILDKRQFPAEQKLFYLSLVVSLPLAFLNGYGASALFYILRVPEATQFHGDWVGIGKILTSAPPEYLLTFQYSLLIFLIYLTFFIFVISKSFKIIRTHWLFLLLSLGLIAPFFAARQLPLAILLSTPLLALSISTGGRLSFRIGMVAALILLLLIIKSNPTGIGEDVQTFPISMITFMKENNLSDNVFNTQRIGSFLSYHLYPQIKVFSDTRDDLFLNTTILQDMARILHSQKKMAQFLDSYNVDIVIVDLTEGSSYPFLLKDGWVTVYKDSLYLILVPEEDAKEKGLKLVK